MAHEIFSLSTINTKRNLLAVSAISIIHAFGWIDLTELPFVGGVANAGTPISGILLAVLVYLAYSTILHVQKDLKNQNKLPTVEEVKQKKLDVYESFKIKMSNYLIDVGPGSIAFELETIKKIFSSYSESIEQHVGTEDKNKEADFALLYIKLGFETDINRNDSFNKNDKKQYKDAIADGLNGTYAQFIAKINDPINTKENNLFNNFLEKISDLDNLNKTETESTTSNYRLQSFEVQTPAWVTAFATGCLLGRIFC